MAKAKTTRERIAHAALRLFERRGYDATTVDQIADAAGVSHMTFFRYFPTKEAVLLSDPFDPLIASSIAAQPASLAIIERVGRGLLVALETVDEQIDRDVRRRIRIAAGVPSLRARMFENNRATEDAIVDALAADGTDRFCARVAAAACLAAIATALHTWATAKTTGATLAETVRDALAVVVPSSASEAA